MNRNDVTAKNAKGAKEKLLFPDECYAIQGAVFDVYREMGCGFLEAVYQECLSQEKGQAFQDVGLAFSDLERFPFVKTTFDTLGRF
ncbi:MAG: hypothetical protein FJ119_07095 [Deltaproteobacteria bacterium]|nr:hypothetical protein [Deltaproteobacteria bacterium]